MRRVRAGRVGWAVALGGSVLWMLFLWAVSPRVQTTVPRDMPLAAAANPPNIVVVMTDDLDVGSLATAIDVGFMPNLVTHLIAGGTTFSESFVTLPLCCPSRSTYLTGQYPHNHGVVRNDAPAGGFERFDDDSTVATWLWAGGRGYRTGHIGKYLNEYFDGRYVAPGYDEWQALVDPSTYCVYDYTISNNGRPITYGHREKDYQTDVLAGLAKRFILEADAEDDARPFFLTITPIAPHVEGKCSPGGIRPAPRHEGTPPFPLPMPPSFNEPDMSDKPEWMRLLRPRDPQVMATIYNDRLRALRAVDDLIGTVVATLRRTGETRQTALLFTSDNGFLLGLHRWRSKVLLYEESIRVPLIIRVPWLDGPATVAESALNNDLAPTIAALAGVTPGLPVDGRSLLPLLRGTARSWRVRFLVEYPPAPQSENPGMPYFGVRAGAAGDAERLVYAETLNPDGTQITDREHYDLAADRYQLQSLHADDSPERRRQRQALKRHLERLKTCAAEICRKAER